MIRRFLAALRRFFAAPSTECAYQQNDCTPRSPCPFCERDIVNGEYRC